MYPIVKQGKKAFAPKRSQKLQKNNRKGLKGTKKDYEVTKKALKAFQYFFSQILVYFSLLCNIFAHFVAILAIVDLGIFWCIWPDLVHFGMFWHILVLFGAFQHLVALAAQHLSTLAPGCLNAFQPQSAFWRILAFWRFNP